MERTSTLRVVVRVFTVGGDVAALPRTDDNGVPGTCCWRDVGLVLARKEVRLGRGFGECA